VNPPSQPKTEAELYTGSVVRLTSLFFDQLANVGQFESVKSSELPEPYRSLLAHNEHMTVTLEAYHDSLVNVETLAEWHDANCYSRNSLLTRQSDGMVLQFGVMRIWLTDLPAAVRDEIAFQHLPLGRVLIKHNMLRQVELIALWQIRPGSALRQHFAIPGDRTVYGRSAQILVDERPTVQMLEIIAPAVS
jgi:chorismate-pyruvate lyase